MKGLKVGFKVSKKIATAAGVLLLSFVMFGPGALAVGDTYPTIGETTYGGRAFGVGIKTLFGDAYFGDTGSLPSSGGALFADYTPVDTDVADGTVLLSYARGFNDVAISEPATSDVTLLEGTLFEVGASFVYSASEASCSGVSGYSEIFDLSIGGVSFPVSGQANEVIYSIPGVFTLIANEQIDQSWGTTHSITVNALHAWSQGLELIVSSAESAVTCSLGGGLFSTGSVGTRGGVGALSTGSAGGIKPAHFPPPKDFMTGGGFFFADGEERCNGAPFSGDRINFGFNAGPRPGSWPLIKGHLNLVDHGPNCRRHIQGTDVTFYEPFGDPEHCRRWGDSNGAAKVDGVIGYNYAVVTCDYGEPGRDDRFAIDVWAGAPGSDPTFENVVYHADNGVSACGPGTCQGDLRGGNIQLHSFG